MAKVVGALDDKRIMAATTTGREIKMYAFTLIFAWAIPAILIVSALQIPTNLIAAALNQ